MVVPGLKEELERVNRLLPALQTKSSGLATMANFNLGDKFGSSSGPMTNTRNKQQASVDNKK